MIYARHFPPRRDEQMQATDGLRLLVVEDDPLVLTLMEELLVEFGCTLVGPATSVVDALRLVAEAPIEAALLDVGLGPGEDGYPVAEALAERSVPFAFVSGYGPEALPPAWRDRPLLRKPFTAAQLRAAVTALAAGAASTRTG